METLVVIMSCLIVATAITLNERHARERSEWTQERSRLLDRIMARSYTDFVYTTKTEAEADTTAIAPEAPDLAWHEQNFKDHPEQYPDGVEVYD